MEREKVINLKLLTLASQWELSIHFVDYPLWNWIYRTRLNNLIPFYHTAFYCFILFQLAYQLLAQESKQKKSTEKMKQCNIKCYYNFFMLDVYIFQTFWIHSLLFHSALYPTRLTFTLRVSMSLLSISLWLPFGLSLGSGSSRKRAEGGRRKKSQNLKPLFPFDPGSGLQGRAVSLLQKLQLPSNGPFL